MSSEAKVTGCEATSVTHWYCHCCGLKNALETTRCKVCGRPENYVNVGYDYPLHGKGSVVYRPSQLRTILGDKLMISDANGWTSLHTCACNGNAPMLTELLRMDSEVDGLTNCGQTALHLAVHGGHIECIEILLRYQAKVDAMTQFEKNQPIHIAADRGWKDILIYLLENGANPNAINAVERTPLHLVAANGRVDLAALLLKHGSKPDKLDLHGWNPRQVAELCGHRDTQELLVRAMMTEKQPIIKELPRAPWHGELWSSLLETQKEKREDHAKACQREHIAQLEVAKFRAKMAKIGGNSNNDGPNSSLMKAALNSHTISKPQTGIKSGFVLPVRDMTDSDSAVSDDDYSRSAASASTISALTMKDYNHPTIRK